MPQTSPNPLIGLQHITHTSCPECGNSKIESVEIKRQHCNGHFNEYLEFGCGAKYHFSPNFMQVEVETHCETVRKHVLVTATVELHLELPPNKELTEILKNIKAPSGHSWKDYSDWTTGDLITRTRLIQLRPKPPKNK